MPIVTQHAAAVADAVGDAVFMFPDVPVGQIWVGTTAIPTAEPAVESLVTTGGQLVGSMQGNGSYGPWIADHSKRLAISSSGMTPGRQYQAVWHADDQGRQFSTYPSPITTAVVGTVSVAGTLDVLVQNFPPTQPVSGTVDIGALPPVTPATTPIIASSQLAMTGSQVAVPARAAVQGVVFSARKANSADIAIGPAGGVALNTGLLLAPGEMTPVLIVPNSNVFAAIGTAPDVLSFLIL